MSLPRKKTLHMPSASAFQTVRRGRYALNFLNSQLKSSQSTL